MTTRVLHVIDSLSYESGGPLRSVVDFSAAGMRLGLQSELLGTKPVRIPDNPLGMERIHSLDSFSVGGYRYVRGLKDWCQTNLQRFDGVMLHGMWSNLNRVVSRECLTRGLPYIVCPHGMLDLWSVRGQGMMRRLKKTMYWHLYERKLVENSSGLVFTLQREMENSKWTFPFSPVRTFVVAPSGMVPVSPLAANEVPDTQVRQDDAAKIALFLGRVHPKKRPDLLIEAWSAAGLPSDWRLLIAGFGDPAYLNQLAKLAKQKGVGDSIQFVGPVAGVNKRYLFQRASWFLLPSHQENFGVAVLEAASAGCAIAISDQVYLADEFPKGAEVLPVQVDAWTRFMRERMTNAAWRDETAQRVSDHLKAKFDQESVVRRWVDMICSGLGTTVSAGPQ